MTELEFHIPGLAIRSAANLREHWTARAKRSERERKNLKLGLVASGAGPFFRAAARQPVTFLVTLTRVSPRLLDDDNLVGGFKSTRDQIADELGVDDGSKRISFEYRQEKGPVGVKIRLECDTNGGSNAA